MKQCFWRMIFLQVKVGDHSNALTIAKMLYEKCFLKRC